MTPDVVAMETLVAADGTPDDEEDSTWEAISHDVIPLTSGCSSCICLS